jgi:hypothetical protein
MSTVNNNPVRQHYIPKFYLKGFADEDGKIHLFDRARKSFRATSPDDLSVIKDYYTVLANGVKRYDVEKKLSDIESAAKPVLDKLVQCTPLTTEELNHLHYFLAVQSLRGPGFRDAAEQMESHLIKRVADEIFANPARAEASMRQAGQDVGDAWTPERMAAMYKKYRDRLTVEVDPHRSLDLMINTADHLFNALRRLSKLVVVKAPKDVLYITTDIPIMSHNGGCYYPGATVLGMKDTMLSFPVNRKTLLVLRDHGPDFHVANSSKASARADNCYRASLSYQFTCSSAMAHLQSIVNRTKLMTREPKPMFSSPTEK